MIGRVAAAIGLAVASVASAAGVVAAPATEPAVTGGTSALGNPAVVALATYDGRRWSMCSAAMVRPRILMTAAHCLTRPGSSESVVRVRVFPPGARARVYSDTGPRKPSPVRVASWWRAADYRNGGSVVQANDVAFILLRSDLGTSAFTRLASQAEVARWRSQRNQVVHIGYGGTGGPGYSPVPNLVTLPLETFFPNGANGSTFSTAATQTAAPCPGDSGAPSFVASPPAYYLVGVLAGANGGCAPSVSTTPTDLGFVAIGYLALLNAALTAGGYLPIPSAPEQSAATVRNRDVTVRWRAPRNSPQSVAGYEVTDETGVVVCQTDQLSCASLGLPDGSYGFTVRSRNAEGEGDALPAAVSAVVASPPAPPAPSIQRVTNGTSTIRLTTIAGRTSAVVTSYVVRDQSGVTVCVVVPPTPVSAQLTCAGPTRRGTYTVTAHAETEMGPSPESAPSARFTIR